MFCYSRNPIKKLFKKSSIKLLSLGVGSISMMILSVKVFKIVLNQKTIFFNTRRQRFFERKNVEIEGQLCESFLIALWKMKHESFFYKILSQVFL